MQKHSILLVEDEEHLHEALKLNLEIDGYMVDSAYDGGEALKLIQSAHYDLMILDIMLPDGDGRELLTQLRTNKKTAKIPVLMISAKYTAATIKHGEHKPNGFLAKPFDIDDLLDKIEGILAGKTY